MVLDGMLEMFQSINAHLLSTLTPKAHITNITTPAHAKKTLDASAPAPDAILVVDAALSEKKHKNLVVCIDGTANQFGLKVRRISIATM